MPTPLVFPTSSSSLAGLRAQRYRLKPATVWITGLSGAGKSTLAGELEQRLLQDGRPVLLLDGDTVRHGLNRDLGFSDADRDENIRRIAEVAYLANEAGLLVLVAVISPHAGHRAAARERIGTGRFFEVYLSTSLHTCASRDPKGLYARARAGGLDNFTGVGAAYEAPQQPELRLDAGTLPPAEAARQVLALLQVRGHLTA